MIARIVVGTGRNRSVHNLPCSNNRKEHVGQRIAFGNVLKRDLWPQGRGFKAAKARGLAAAGATA